MEGQAGSSTIIATRPTPLERATAAFEVLLCSGLFSAYAAFALLGAVTGAPPTDGAQSLNPETIFYTLLLESAVLVLLILFFQWSRREGLRELWFYWRRPGREALIGLALVPGLLLLTSAVGLFFKEFLPQHFDPENPLLQRIETGGDLAMYMAISIFAGGFKEELQRAFILNRFERFLYGAWLGLILWSIGFGAGHLIQGVSSAVAAGLLGLVFGLVLLWRRNLTAPMVAHAAYNIASLLLYWYYRAS